MDVHNRLQAMDQSCIDGSYQLDARAHHVTAVPTTKLLPHKTLRPYRTECVRQWDSIASLG